MQEKVPRLQEHRTGVGESAVIFIHGFTGDQGKGTWGDFPDYVRKNKALKNWDIYSLGYATKLSIDIVGIWEANPDIPKLACYLHTYCTNPPLDRYKSIALVAHSMGGLIVQRALADYDNLLRVVSLVFLFGTPSGGLVKASPLRLLNRQVRDMVRNGPFIRDLRQRWVQKFSEDVGKSLPFSLWAIAGDRDEFVPAGSSLVPFQKDFPQANIAVVPGNHLEIIKPDSPNHLSAQLLCKGLQGNAGVSGPWSGAAVAVESRDFQKALELLEPHQDELDADAIVLLALALESVGRSKDAISLLEKHKDVGTDPMGVLAGRLKRRWLVERKKADALRARELYAEGYRRAVSAKDPKNINHDQAMYHSINIAFMDLAYISNRTEAKAKAAEMASVVLNHCKQAEAGKWCYASEAEAYLMRGDSYSALERYKSYINESPTPREVESTYRQAIIVADLMGIRTVLGQLDSLFRGEDVRWSYK